MPKFDLGYAIVIGAGGDLPVTSYEASIFANLLQDPHYCSFPSDQVHLLANSNATRQKILLQLDVLAASAKLESTIIVYFSGHGCCVRSNKQYEEFYLLPYGYDINDLPKTAISGDEFTARLKAIKSNKLIVLLDCCHAGGIAEPKTLGVTVTKAPLPNDVESVLTLGSGRVILASSRRDEVSYTGIPYSQFTQALLESFAGKGASIQDGYVRILDVAIYIGRMVPNRTNDRQHPIIKVVNLDSNLSIAYYAGGAKEPRSLVWNKDDIAQPVVNGISESELAEGYNRLTNLYRRNLLEIEMKMAEFVDQRNIPLDLLKARQGVHQKLDELEKNIV
jgi:hypothetical protein